MNKVLEYIINNPLVTGDSSLAQLFRTYMDYLLYIPKLYSFSFLLADRLVNNNKDKSAI